MSENNQKAWKHLSMDYLRGVASEGPTNLIKYY
jgi:hypothetical protein